MTEVTFERPDSEDSMQMIPPLETLLELPHKLLSPERIVPPIQFYESEETESDYSDEKVISVHELNNNKKVGLCLLPDQRQKFSYRKGGQFNLLIAGQVGVGKSTFINTLFDYELLKKDPNYCQDFLSYDKFQLIENNFKFNLNVTETSGFGQYIDNDGTWIPIKNFIQQQFRLYLFQDQQPLRVRKWDNRIHCCIYVLPNNIKQLNFLDIETIKSLSSIINLIPIIGKCDVLNSEEIRDYKMKFKHILRENNIKICDFLNDEDLCERINDQSPFSFIGSNDLIENSNGQMVRGRKYPWGSVEIENESFCDFNIIKQILISENMLDFILSTETSYEHFRTNFLSDICLKNFTQLSISADSETEGNEMKVYYNYKSSDYVKDTKDEDEVLQYKESKLKEMFNVIIGSQEKRFKDWKKALVAKQEVFNKDLEDTHAKMIQLYEEVSQLEDDFVSNNPTLKRLDLNDTYKNFDKDFGLNW